MENPRTSPAPSTIVNRAVTPRRPRKEIRALRQLRRENLQSRYVFNTERGGPVTRAWFLKMVGRTWARAPVPTVRTAS
jgi:hypothetical protein